MSRYAELLALIENPGEDCILWDISIGSAGYGMVWHDGKVQGVHTLALASTTPPPAGVQYATHSCRPRACVNPLHLSWQSPAGNSADKLRDGTDNRGEKHPLARLTEDDVLAIRNSYVKGVTRMQDIADQFGITRQYVGHLLCGRAWGHMS